MEIRNPDQTHLSALVELVRRCHPAPWTQASLSDLVFYDSHYDPNHVWMAREQGKMLGFLVSVQAGPLAWLKFLVVDPAARRKGLGGDLLSRGQFRLAGEGVKEWRIEATPPREFVPGVDEETGAGAFLEAQGFLKRDPYDVEWVAPFAGEAPAETDRERALEWARDHCGPHVPWIEEQLSFRPSRAVFREGVGLCLADPGASLGPLWAEAGAPADQVRALAKAAASIASAAPAHEDGWRVWQVKGSLPLGAPRTLSKTFHAYSKTL